MSKQSANAPDKATRLVEIGRITKAHGIRGEVRVVLHNAESTLIGDGKKLVIRPAPATPVLPDRTLRVLRVREAPGALIVAFADVSDRDQAEALHGSGVLLRRDEFPPLEDGEFYACDVEGAEVFGPDGEKVGVTLALVDYPTCSVLRVQKPDQSIVEYPLVEAVIGSVDVEAGRVTLLDAEGL